MRAFGTVLALLIFAAGAYLGYAHFSGGEVPTFGLPLGGEKKNIRDTTQAFYETIKFKNRDAIKHFVDATATQEDISDYLTKTFGEGALNEIDLNSVSIEQIELDSQETRARVKILLSGLYLDDKKAFTINKLLYFYRANSLWLLDLKSP